MVVVHLLANRIKSLNQLSEDTEQGVDGEPSRETATHLYVHGEPRKRVAPYAQQLHVVLDSPSLPNDKCTIMLMPLCLSTSWLIFPPILSCS